MNFKEAYWPNWQQSRINYISKKLGDVNFSDKTILELAPFNGYIGNHFHKLGAKVTCVEGRKENYEDIKEAYPHLTTHHYNLDTPEWIWGEFDIIINWGLLYHLEKYHRELLVNCVKNSKLLLLESVVTLLENIDIEPVNEVGVDQSLSNVGGRPSITWIEKILKENNCVFEQIRDPSLNAGSHMYSGTHVAAYNRCMWIINTQ